MSDLLRLKFHTKLKINLHLISKPSFQHTVKKIILEKPEKAIISLIYQICISVILLFNLKVFKESTHLTTARK